MPETIHRTSKHVRHRYGDISDMTLWRWINDAEMNFPKPLYINGRRYWTDEQLDAFDRSRADATLQAA